MGSPVNRQYSPSSAQDRASGTSLPEWPRTSPWPHYAHYRPRGDWRTPTVASGTGGRGGGGGTPGPCKRAGVKLSGRSACTEPIQSPTIRGGGRHTHAPRRHHRDACQPRCPAVDPRPHRCGRRPGRCHPHHWLRQPLHRPCGWRPWWHAAPAQSAQPQVTYRMDTRKETMILSWACQGCHAHSPRWLPRVYSFPHHASNVQRRLGALSQAVSFVATFETAVVWLVRAWGVRRCRCPSVLPHPARAIHAADAQCMPQNSLWRSVVAGWARP